MFYNRSYRLEDVLTAHVYELIKAGKSIMVFTGNLQLLVDDEINEWNQLNGLTDNTPRVIGHKTTVRGEEIYVLHHINDASDVIIPMKMTELFPVYGDFIYQMKTDLGMK